MSMDATTMAWTDERAGALLDQFPDVTPQMREAMGALGGPARATAAHPVAMADVCEVPWDVAVAVHEQVPDRVDFTGQTPRATAVAEAAEVAEVEGPSAMERFKGWMSRTSTAIVKDLHITIIAAAVGFGVGWLGNVAVMGDTYDGFRVPSGAAATGLGNLLRGTLFWFFASALASAIVGYRLRVGSERFWDDVKDMPVSVRRALTEDGDDTATHLLVGFAGASVIVYVVGPSISAVFAVGALLLVGRALRTLATGALMYLWRTVAARIAPRRASPPPAIALLVGVIGTAGAFAVGTVVSSPATTLGLGVVAALAAVLVSRQGGEVPPAAAVLILGGVTLALLLGADIVFADDGGFSECGDPGLIGYIFSCNGSGQVLGLALVGGAASGAGAVVGAAGAGGAADGGGGRPGSGGDGGDGEKPPKRWDEMTESERRRAAIGVMHREDPTLTAEEITKRVDQMMTGEDGRSWLEKQTDKMVNSWMAKKAVEAQDAVRDEAKLWMDGGVVRHMGNELWKDLSEGDMLWRGVEAPFRAGAGVVKAGGTLVGGVLKGGAYLVENGPELTSKSIDYLTTHSAEEINADMMALAAKAPEFAMDMTDAQIAQVQSGLKEYEKLVLAGDPRADQMLQDVVGQAGFDYLLGMGIGKAVEGGKGWVNKLVDPDGIGVPHSKKPPNVDDMTWKDKNGGDDRWKDFGGDDKPGTLKETGDQRIDRKYDEMETDGRTPADTWDDIKGSGRPNDTQIGTSKPRPKITGEDIGRLGGGGLVPDFDGPPAPKPDADGPGVDRSGSGGKPPARVGDGSDAGSGPAGYTTRPGDRGRPSFDDTSQPSYPKAPPRTPGDSMPDGSTPGTPTPIKGGGGLDPLDAPPASTPVGYGGKSSGGGTPPPPPPGTVTTPTGSVAPGSSAPPGYGGRPTGGQSPPGSPDMPDGPGPSPSGYDTRPGQSGADQAGPAGYDTRPGQAQPDQPTPSGYDTRPGQPGPDQPSPTGYDTPAGQPRPDTPSPTGYDTPAGKPRPDTPSPTGYDTPVGQPRPDTPSPTGYDTRPGGSGSGSGSGSGTTPPSRPHQPTPRDRLPGETDAQLDERMRFEDDVKANDANAAEEAGYDTSGMRRDGQGEFDGWRDQENFDEYVDRKVAEADERPTGGTGDAGPDGKTSPTVTDRSKDPIPGPTNRPTRPPADRLDLDGMPTNEQVIAIRNKANQVDLPETDPAVLRMREQLQAEVAGGKEVKLSHEQAERLFGIDKPILDERGNTILQGSDGAAGSGISSQYKLSLADDTSIKASTARQDYDDIWTGKWNTTSDKGYKPGEEVLMPPSVRRQFDENPLKPGETINYTPRELSLAEQATLREKNPVLLEQYLERKDQAGKWDKYTGPENAKVIDYSKSENDRYGPMWVAEDTSGPVSKVMHWKDPVDGRIYVQYQTKDGTWHPPKRQISDVDTVTHQGSDRPGYDYDSQREMQYQQAKGQLGEGDSAAWGMSMVEQTDGSFVLKPNESPNMFYKSLDAVHKARKELVITQDLDGVRLSRPEIPQWDDMVRAAQDMEWSTDQAAALIERKILPKGWSRTAGGNASSTTTTTPSTPEPVSNPNVNPNVNPNANPNRNPNANPFNG